VARSVPAVELVDPALNVHAQHVRLVHRND
jgi:hypothetical protein